MFAGCVGSKLLAEAKLSADPERERGGKATWLTHTSISTTDTQDAAEAQALSRGATKPLLSGKFC